jgi:protein SCO1/2
MNRLIFFFLVMIFSFILGCENPLPIERKIEGSFELLNQDSDKVIFPDKFNGNILVTGFIFTNCPDICPMTIHNMQLIQKKLNAMNITNVNFAAVSFDPLRDTPAILKEQSELRDVDPSNFNFLTGDKKEIDSLLDELKIVAFTNDTTYTENGDPVYFFVHTDRITLIDQKGFIRNEYSGSRIIVEDIVADIKYLGE